jgi:hypothetical protein
LARNEALAVLIFSGKRFIGLNKLKYFYKAKFLKEGRMGQQYTRELNVSEK